MSVNNDPRRPNAEPATERFFRRAIAGFLLIAVAAGGYAATLLL